MSKFAPRLSKRERLSTVVFHPRPYQSEAIKWGLERPAAGFLLAPGLGKTIIMLTIFYILKRRGIVHKMLVVSKRRIIHSVWPKENRKWNLNFSISVLHGSKKFIALQQNVDIYLINYEGLVWLRRQPKKLREQFDILCCDESSMVKNWSALRTQALRKMLPSFDRRYILSGSPTPRSLMDIFSQTYILDMGDALGKFITKFRNMFFYPSGFKGKEYELQEGGEERIYKKLKKLMLRFGTDELDLPPLIFVDRYVELPDKARKIYRGIEEDFIAELRSGHVIAANAGVATQKCRQIAGGALYVEKGSKVFETIHDEKLDELENLLEELQEQPCLVAYEFDHERKRIQERFPDIPHIGGGVSDKDADILIDKWNAGELPVLLGHPDSIAHGLNLQGTGGCICFFATGWSMENYWQFIYRLWRQGQLHKVVVYRIIVEDTVDETIVEVQNIKHANQERLFRALEKRYMPARKQKTTELPGKLPAAAKVAEILLRHMKSTKEKDRKWAAPRYEHDDEDAERADYNFVSLFMQTIGGWLPEMHSAFLTEVFGKKIRRRKLADLYDLTKTTIMQTLRAGTSNGTRCYVLEDRQHALSIWPIKTQKESKMADTKNGSKFGGKKTPTKKAPTKKAPAERGGGSKKKKKKKGKRNAASPIGRGLDGTQKVTRTKKEASTGIHKELQGCVPKTGISVTALTTAFSKKSEHDRAKDAGFVQGYIRGAVRRGYLNLA